MGRPRRIDKAGHLIFPDGQNRGRGSGALDRGQFDREEEVLWPDGCAAMYRKAMLDRDRRLRRRFLRLWRRCRARAARAHRRLAMHLHAAGRGAAPSRLDAGERIRRRRLELIERNRLLLAIKLFPVEPAVAQPVLLRGARWRRAALAARRGAGDTAHFPGWRGKWRMARALICAAIWRRCAWRPRMLRKRAAIRRIRRLSPGEVRRLLLAPPAEPEGSGMSACLVCGSERFARLFQAPTGCTHHRQGVRRGALRRSAGWCGSIRSPPPEELRRYYPGKLLVRARPKRRRPAGGSLPAPGAARPRALRRRGRCADTRARGPLLDVGCGGGLFLGMMRERGFRVRGPGLFRREAAAIAWRRQQVPAVCGMLEHAPLRAGSFAGITMFHVLEHLYDPRAYLAAAHQLLPSRTAGWWCRCPTPPAGSSACWAAPGTAWTCRATCSISATATWRRLLESCGFEVVRRKYFSLRDNPAGLASSLAPCARPHGAPRARASRESARRAPGQGPGVLRAGGWRRCRFTVLEAACRAGSTVMIEARKPMSYTALAYRLPRPLRRHILHFEAEIEDAVAAFAGALPAGARVLDAGAGEGQYARYFARQRYCGVDLAVGDAAWDYSRLDARGRSHRAAVPRGAFDAAHAHRDHRASARAGRRAGRNRAHAARPAATAAGGAARMGSAPGAARLFPLHALRPGVPAGEGRLRSRGMRPAGGYFRLLARRLLNGLQFFTGGVRWLLFLPAAILLVPPALDSAVPGFSRPGPQFHSRIHCRGADDEPPPK